MNPGPLLHLALLFAATALPAATCHYCQFAGKTSQEFAGENQPPLR